MGALSFKATFAEKVIAGLEGKKNGKRQSIRNFRKRPLKVGEKVYLYVAMRTKWCKKLGESTIKSRQSVYIGFDKIVVYDELNPTEVDVGLPQRLKYRRAITRKDALDRFARADGFSDWETMKRWWVLTHGPDALPFQGNLYKW